jgi:hypothetical protein
MSAAPLLCELVVDARDDLGHGVGALRQLAVRREDCDGVDRAARLPDDVGLSRLRVLVALALWLRARLDALGEPVDLLVFCAVWITTGAFVVCV